MQLFKITRRRPKADPRPTGADPRRRSRWRQSGAALTVLALVGAAGCSPPRPPVGVEGYVEGFLGGAIADEPRAALAARDVLSAGGNAADAAVALYFMLAVTYPSAAALGGGGVCLAYSNEKKLYDSYEFLARAPAGGGPIALPGNVRGMAALHARQGKSRWENLLLPAEQAARSGHPVSRALARRIEANRAAIAGDPRLAERFGRREGDALGQADLAVLIGQLRVRGAGDLYTGEAAKTLLADQAAAGGAIGADELRSYAVNLSPPLTFPVGSHLAAVPPGGVGGERFQGLWRALADNSAYRHGAPEQRPKLLADAVAAAYADLGGPLGLGDRGSTGFVTASTDGSAVACALSMNVDFGSRRLGRQSGVLFGAAPVANANGAPYLAPFLLVNTNTRQAFFAGAPAGAGAGLPALVTVAVEAIVNEVPLDQAIGAPRLVAAGPVVVYEPGLPAGALSQFEGRQLSELPNLGRVNVFYCFDGLRRNATSCKFIADGRGFGMIADRRL